MATEKRERQKANRQLKREQEQRAERRDRIRQYVYIGVIVAVAIIGGLALINFASGDDGPEPEAAASDATDATETGDADDSADEAATDEADDAAADAAEETAAEEVTEPIECPAEDGSSEQVLEFPTSPPVCIDETATYVATIDTNLGEITAELDAAAAPATVNNFVYLARYHYYDGTAFHRIIQDFVVQGGDPIGDPPGTGNPGYFIAEEPPADGTYAIGDLAMAKQTAEGTTGGQFFIVTGPDGAALPPLYSRFGQVTAGLDVVEAIQALPTDDRDFPTEEIIVNSVTITEG